MARNVFIKAPRSVGGIFLASPNNDDPSSLALARINLRFLSLFKQPKNELLSDIHLVITFSGGELSLWQSKLAGWKCLETEIIQPSNSNYQHLKTYAHHVLLIDAQLTGEVEVENNYVYILEESPQFLSVIHQDIPGQLLSQLHRLEANKALGKRVFNDPFLMYSDVLSSARNIGEELNRPLLQK